MARRQAAPAQRGEDRKNASRSVLASFVPKASTITSTDALKTDLRFRVLPAGRGRLLLDCASSAPHRDQPCAANHEETSRGRLRNYVHGKHRTEWAPHVDIEEPAADAAGHDAAIIQEDRVRPEGGIQRADINAPQIEGPGSLIVTWSPLAPKSDIVEGFSNWGTTGSATNKKTGLR